MKIVSVDSPNRKRLETQRESTSPVLNPVIDEVNRTADLAVELILSAMGKKIL